jgi:hypothetical protein
MICIIIPQKFNFSILVGLSLIGILLIPGITSADAFTSAEEDCRFMVY